MLDEFLCAAGLMLVHLFARLAPFFDRTPRSRWLSAAGGISIAYVFIDVFPALADAQVALGRAGSWLPFAERHAYLIALTGLLVFYVIESIVSRSQQSRSGASAPSSETTTAMGVFWLHMASFAVYNALVGYLLVRGERHGTRALLFYFVAMAVHFALNDHALRQDHRETYTRVGRWLLAVSIPMGWAVGLATEVSDAATGLLIAFLAGGVVMNVMKEEEPGRAGLFPFVVGAACYAALLLA